MNKTCVAVNIQTNEMIHKKSIAEMARFLDVHPSTVSRAASGDRNKQTVRGHVFAA
jgi:DNA-binding MurR/RpiR family transcriptional regulator